MSPWPGRRQPGRHLSPAWGALAVSVLAHGLAVAGMAAMAGPPSCPPLLPRIVLTAALAPAGCGSGPAGPAAAPAAPAAPEPEEAPRPPVEPVAANAIAPTPDPVVPSKKEPKPVTPKRPVTPVAKVKKPRTEPEAEPVAAAATPPAAGPTEATAAQPGGGSGASSGPPLVSGGGAGPGSIGSPLGASELDNQPALVFAPKPEYPFQAKRRGLRALLRVRLLVDTVGRVERVDILSGEHAEAFAETVRTTLAHWRFKPGTRKGAPVHWVAILPIAFELE